MMNARRRRDRYLRRRYRITVDDYEHLLAAHDGGCWICGRRPTNRRLHVEHDHKNDRIRGLACWPCNALLERAKDKPGILRQAAAYLESDEADRILGKGSHAK